MKSRAPISIQNLIPLLGVALLVVSCGPGNAPKPGAAKSKTNSPAATAKSPGAATNSAAAATKPTEKPAAVSATISTNAVEIPKSVFLIPTNAVVGKDPFFPHSTYPYGTTVVTPTSKSNKVDAIPDLVINGLSGTPEKPLAIINSFTFGIGDNRDIPLAGGKRVVVQCLEINLQTGTVNVQVGGQQRMLKLKPVK